MAINHNVWAWSATVPADNATVDASINWAEGQDPATVNNSARGMMTAIAKMADVQSGNVTVADSGDPSAITIATGQSIEAAQQALGFRICFKAATTNTGPVTVAVDGLTAVAVQRLNGDALVAGDIVTGGLYDIAFDGTNYKLLGTSPATSAGENFVLTSTDAGAAAGPVLTLYRNSATPAASDILGSILWAGEDGAGNTQTYAQDFVTIADPTSGSEDGLRKWQVTTAGAAWVEMTLSGAALYPETDDGLALGDAVHGWSDIFVASGGLLTFDNGDVTVTHSTNTLTVTGGQWAVSDTVGGLVLIHATSTQSSSVGIRITNTDAAPLFDPLTYQQFYTGGTLAGSITGTISSPTVAYNTSSDYRLKEDIRDLDDAGDIIDAIRPRRFKWKNLDLQGIGFVAHELQEVVPEAVAGQKDAVDKDGSILPQGIDFSKLVPYLVAEIQALRARVAALEAAT